MFPSLFGYRAGTDKKAIFIMRPYVQSILLLLLSFSLSVLAISCAHHEPPHRPSPYVMEGKEGVFLNTFTLQQGDFPILGGPEQLHDAPEYERLPDRKTVVRIAKRFKEHGYFLRKDYPFNFGKIHVKLDGYDPKHYVGFIFVSKDDYEEPKQPPDALESRQSYFYTEKDPSRISVPELLMLEQLNGQERAYIALINAHQFTWPVGEADQQEVMEKRLQARVDLYLSWVDARLAKRAEQEAAKKEEP